LKGEWTGGKGSKKGGILKGKKNVNNWVVRKKEGVTQFGNGKGSWGGLGENEARWKGVNSLEKEPNSKK